MRGASAFVVVCGSVALVARPNDTANHFWGTAIRPLVELPAGSNGGSGCGWKSPVRSPPSVPAVKGVTVWSPHDESPLVTNGPSVSVPLGWTMRNHDPSDPEASHVPGSSAKSPTSAESPSLVAAGSG